MATWAKCLAEEGCQLNPYKRSRSIRARPWHYCALQWMVMMRKTEETLVLPFVKFLFRLIEKGSIVLN